MTSKQVFVGYPTKDLLSHLFEHHCENRKSTFRNDAQRSAGPDSDTLNPKPAIARNSAINEVRSCPPPAKSSEFRREILSKRRKLAQVQFLNWMLRQRAGHD
jgi:hypothetical protein